MRLLSGSKYSGSLSGHGANSLWLSSLLCLGFAAIIFGYVFESLYVGLTIALFGSILITCAQKCFCSKAIVPTLLFAFVFGIFVATLIYFGYIADYGEPFWVPGADDQVYEQVAIRAYNAGYVTVFDMFGSSEQYIRQHNAKGWVMYVVYLMRIGDGLDGYHSMVPRVINIFSLNIIGLIVTKCFSERHEVSEKWLVVMLLCAGLFPNALIISSHVYRDTVNALLVASCYFLVLSLRGRKHKIAKVFLIVSLTYMAYWLRAMNVFFIAGLVVVALLPGAIKQLKSNLTILVIAAIALLLGASLFAFNSELFLGYITRYGERITSGESRFVSLIYGLPLLPLGLPLRIAAYLCSPFYYRVFFDPASWLSSTESVTHLVVSMGTVILVAQYAYGFRGLKADYRTGLALLVVLVGICISTSGYRHVMMVYPMLLLLIAEGKYAIHRMPEKKPLYRMTSLLLASSMCLLFGAVSLL